MRDFFRGLQAQHNPPEGEPKLVLPEQYAWLRKQYVHFCNARLTSIEQIEDDLKQLLALPEITTISFATNENGLSLLLGTSNIYITNPKTGITHDIGEFVIVVNRSQNQKSIRFYNVTRTVGGDENRNECFHPHILASSAVICMNSGWPQLIEHVGDGRMYDATRIMLKALSITNGTPYLNVENWPKKGLTHVEP